VSRTWVSNDAGTVMAEITQDDEGYATGRCQAGDWATNPDRYDTLHDVTEHAGTHMDQAH